jgi:hypothetical protein
LRGWLGNRWIVAHEPSVEEMTDLFTVIDRDADLACKQLFVERLREVCSGLE